MTYAPSEWTRDRRSLAIHRAAAELDRRAARELAADRPDDLPDDYLIPQEDDR